ncbi:MAG: cytochrome c biogenesis protein ResB [Oscillibacter sp.]|nr:cytochrome c biogenesis protein ResB [Oscillibacter sp.]
MAKKIWKFLSSMRFAVFLLVLLAAACALASLVSQGQTAAWYQDQYGPRTAGLILPLHLDDAFHSFWFVLISGFLCLNLLLCNVVHFPGATRKEPPRRMPPASAVTAEAKGIPDLEAFLAELHMGQPVRLTEGARNGAGTVEGADRDKDEDTGGDTSGDRGGTAELEILYAEKNRAGRWGPWLCHLGILLLVTGFSLGQAMGEEYTVYGVPGQARPAGDTGLTVTIDDFQVETADSGSIRQYTTDLTVTAADGASESASTGVNAPARLFGYSFYQNSTGWAAQMDILKDGEPLSSDILCVGEYRTVPDKPELIIYFNAFYPDYELIPGSGPTTRSQEVNNPAYLYMVYYMGEFLGMNVLLGDEPLTIDEYTVTFSEPQHYSLVQVNRDPFAPLVFLGGLIVTAGLFLAFYVQSAEVWAVREEDGWRARGLSQKGGALFREQFLRAAERAGGRPVQPAEGRSKGTAKASPGTGTGENVGVKLEEHTGEGDSHAAS